MTEHPASAGASSSNGLDTPHDPPPPPPPLFPDLEPVPTSPSRSHQRPSPQKRPLSSPSVPATQKRLLASPQKCLSRPARCGEGVQLVTAERPVKSSPSKGQNGLHSNGDIGGLVGTQTRESVNSPVPPQHLVSQLVAVSVSQSSLNGGMPTLIRAHVTRPQQSIVQQPIPAPPRLILAPAPPRSNIVLLSQAGPTHHFQPVRMMQGAPSSIPQPIAVSLHSSPVMTQPILSSQQPLVSSQPMTVTHSVSQAVTRVVIQPSAQQQCVSSQPAITQQLQLVERQPPRSQPMIQPATPVMVQPGSQQVMVQPASQPMSQVMVQPAPQSHLQSTSQIMIQHASQPQLQQVTVQPMSQAIVQPSQQVLVQTAIPQPISQVMVQPASQPRLQPSPQVMIQSAPRVSVQSIAVKPPPNPTPPPAPAPAPAAVQPTFPGATPIPRMATATATVGETPVTNAATPSTATVAKVVSTASAVVTTSVPTAVTTVGAATTAVAKAAATAPVISVSGPITTPSPRPTTPTTTPATTPATTAPSTSSSPSDEEASRPLLFEYPADFQPSCIKLMNSRGDPMMCHNCDYKTRHLRYLVHHTAHCSNTLPAIAPSSLVVATPITIPRLTAPSTGVQCRLCPFKADQVELLQSHMQESHTPLYSCNYCPYQTREQRDIKRHLENECRTRPPKCYTCLLCSPVAVMYSEVEIRNHFVNSHNYQPLQKVTEYPVTVGYAHDPRKVRPPHGHCIDRRAGVAPPPRAVQKLTARPPIAAPPRPCPFEFDEGRSPRQSPLPVRPAPIPGRPKLPEKSPLIGDRIQGMITNSLSKGFSCGECTFKTKTTANLRSHIRRAHPRGCKLCNFRGSSDEMLQQHMKGKHPEVVTPVPDEEPSISTTAVTASSSAPPAQPQMITYERRFPLSAPRPSPRMAPKLAVPRVASLFTTTAAPRPRPGPKITGVPCVPVTPRRRPEVRAPVASSLVRPRGHQTGVSMAEKLINHPSKDENPL